jgi:F0F1-type ATP synthase assembly protein I
MIATIGIGAGIGYFIDMKTHNQKHLYTAFITLLFVGIALYQVIKSVINDK